MSNKRIKELRNLSPVELAAKVRELEGGVFQGRIKKSTGQLEDTASLWRARKDLARVRMLSAVRAVEPKGSRVAEPEGSKASERK